MFIAFFFALVIFQGAVSEELGIAALRPGGGGTASPGAFGAYNPYAHMAELPYPPVYGTAGGEPGAGGLMVVVPQGVKVPLAQVQQAAQYHTPALSGPTAAAAHPPPQPPAAAGGGHSAAAAAVIAAGLNNANAV
jgi:hypothetical protein